MKVLISAFACLPNWGSEPGVGWNWIINMSKYNKVYVVTRGNNKELIEREISKTNIKNVKFFYISVPGINWIEDRADTKLIHLYYRIWQKYILKKVKKLDEIYNFDIIHHITYNEFRNPGYLWKINKPFILGPIGGGQSIEKNIKMYCEGNINLIQEFIRDFINFRAKKSQYVKRAIKKASKVLIADSSTYSFLNCSENNKFELMLETGIKEEQLSNKVYRKKEKINLFWSGNLIYRKGLGLLIDAFYELENKDNYIVNIIGDGPLKHYYSEKIKKMGLSEYFNFIGRVPFNDLQEMYKECDVFIFTSLRDTSGNVVLEAMAKGIPIITLNHHGVGDIVTKDCGIKVDVTTKDEIVSNIKSAIETMMDVDKRKIYGENSIKRIKEEYLWSKKGENMQKIYNEVVL